MKEAFAQSSEEVLKGFGVDVNAGLSHEEASNRLAQYGRNQIEQSKTVPWWKLLLNQFKG